MSVQSELPDPSSNEATITIQKTVRGDLTAEHRAELQSRLYFEIREGGTVLQTLPAAALGDWKQNGSDWWISKSIPISDEWVGKTVDVVECKLRDGRSLLHRYDGKSLGRTTLSPLQPAQILLRQRLSEIRRNADGGKKSSTAPIPPAVSFVVSPRHH